MILEISISNFKSIENARKLDEELNEILREEMRKWSVLDVNQKWGKRGKKVIEGHSMNVQIATTI